MFHLMIDNDDEMALERRVMYLMEPGALLMLFGILLNPPGWEEVGFHVWRKP